MRSSMPDAAFSRFPVRGQTHGSLLGDGRRMTEAGVLPPGLRRHACSCAPVRSRHRHSRVQRGARPRRKCPTAARVPRRRGALSRPNHGGRQRQHRRDVGGRASAGGGTARRRRDPSGRQGARRCTARGMDVVDGDLVVYMDVDLSTDLTALMPLVAPLDSGHSDVAIGSRLSASSRVVRGPKREFVSRSYNLILRSMLGARFSDAQCGFKAMRADVARQILPLVADTGWFFDTELLVIAERAGLRIARGPGRLDRRLRFPRRHHRDGDRRSAGMLAGWPRTRHRRAAVA